MQQLWSKYSITMLSMGQFLERMSILATKKRLSEAGSESSGRALGERRRLSPLVSNELLSNSWHF